MNEKRLHLVVFGAHIGDAEITAGHIICKYVRAGHKATIVHMTAGEKGHPTMPPEEYKKQKIEETHTSAKLWGCDVKILPYPDGELPLNEEVKLTVADIIREIKPDIVLTHWKGSFHKDHINTHYAVVEGIFYAAVPGIKTPKNLPAHGIKQLFFTDNWEDSIDFQPNYFLNLDEESYNLWVEGIKKHALFRGEVASFPYFEYYTALTVVRGAKMRFKRAVAFMVPPFAYFRKMEFFPVDEVMEIY